MPELIDQMYCSQQIVIPPKFPYILKRYAKAAIKTQPYDLLRWSYEYFKALDENRMPPVKLRLEYPIYSTQGGLTRGYLKVLALQLEGVDPVPLTQLKALWLGACLDASELNRVLCLCEVYRREDSVPRLRFLSVTAGLLTKTLTHTMILLCETLTKEADGGSAAIPVGDFLMMYRFLAAVDASKDVKYFDGYREGETPKAESTTEEDEAETVVSTHTLHSEDKLRELSGGKITSKENVQDEQKTVKIEETKKEPDIFVSDEDGNAVALEFYGEPKVTIVLEEDLDPNLDLEVLEEQVKEEEKLDEREQIAIYVAQCYHVREERIEDLKQTFDDIAALVERFKSANYDLSMVAGRQMSTTSGEFIVYQIEKDMMDVVGEQIAVLPDPDLKKKKAKPEEVAMIKDLLEQFLDDNMDLIVPEVEELEEEEAPIPEITIVYAVPGIGPAVDEEIVQEFTEYALEVSKTQAEEFMPRNIRHFLCPPLEKLPECNFEVDQKKFEEVPTGGVITD